MRENWLRMHVREREEEGGEREGAKSGWNNGLLEYFFIMFFSFFDSKIITN